MEPVRAPEESLKCVSEIVFLSSSLFYLLSSPFLFYWQSIIVFLCVLLLKENTLNNNITCQYTLLHMFFICSFNFFASRFWAENKPFHLENAAIFTHEFLYDNFNNLRKLSKICPKIFVSNLMHFMKNWFLFFLKNEALRSESLYLIQVKLERNVLLHIIPIKKLVQI